MYDTITQLSWEPMHLNIIVLLEKKMEFRKLNMDDEKSHFQNKHMNKFKEDL